jgi:hypothetical protein
MRFVRRPISSYRGKNKCIANEKWGKTMWDRRFVREDKVLKSILPKHGVKWIEMDQDRIHSDCYQA